MEMAIHSENGSTTSMSTLTVEDMSVLRNYGEMLSKLKKHSQSWTILQEYLNGIVNHVQSQPSSLEATSTTFDSTMVYHTINTCQKIALVYNNNQNYNDAESIIEYCIDVVNKLLLDANLVEANKLYLLLQFQLHFNLSNILCTNKKYQESERYLNVIYNDYFPLLNSDIGNEIKAKVLSNMAVVYQYLQQFNHAEEVLRKKISTYDDIDISNNPEKQKELLLDKYSLSICLDCQKKHSESELLLREILTRFRTLYGSRNEITLNAMASLGISLCHQQKYVNSELLLREALIGLSQLLGPNHQHLINLQQHINFVVEEKLKLQKR
jgi:tetratricopeptide (TPR) repeat protein